MKTEKRNPKSRLYTPRHLTLIFRHPTYKTPLFLQPSNSSPTTNFPTPFTLPTSLTASSPPFKILSSHSLSFPPTTPGSNTTGISGPCGGCVLLKTIRYHSPRLFGVAADDEWVSMGGANMSMRFSEVWATKRSRYSRS